MADTSQSGKTLLEDVKNYLDITFADDDTDKKISDSIQRGTEFLNRIAGCELDYEEKGGHRTLLFSYCRYDLAGKGDEFNKNYLGQILALQIDKELEQYAEKDNL